MSEELPFPESMRDDIAQCVISYDRSVYRAFRKTYMEMVDDVEDFDDFEQHNQYLFKLVCPNIAVSSVLRVLMFLVYSPNLSVHELYSTLTFLAPRVKLNKFLFKVLSVVQDILEMDEHLLSEFVRKVNGGNSHWIHFAVIGRLIERVNPNLASVTVRVFIDAALRFSDVHLKQMKPFLAGIQTPLYMAYVKPFMDKQLLRSAEKFVFKVGHFLRPLEFSIWKSVPHSTPDFVDSLSDLCQSTDERVAAKAGELVSKMATWVSAYAFPMNAKSAIYYFNSVSVAQSSVAVALDLFNQHGTTKDLKTALASFFSRVIHENPSLLDVNHVLSQYLLPNKLYAAIYLILDTPGLNKDLVLSFAKEDMSVMSLVIVAQLGTVQLRESNISLFGTAQNWLLMTKEESVAYGELLYRLRHQLPFYVGKTMCSSLFYLKEKQHMLHALETSLCDCNEEFLDGFFSAFSRRQPAEFNLIVPLLSKFHHKFSLSGKAWCVALGVSIDDDSPEIVRSLLSMRRGDWKKGVDNGLYQLAGRPACHKEICDFVCLHIDDPDYQGLIAAIVKYFDVQTDRKLFESVFCSETPSLELMKACLLARESYKEVPTSVAQLLIHRANIESCSRKFLFSYIPKSSFSSFDFLLFLPFFRFLLSVDEWDEICEAVATRVRQFDSIDYDRGPIIDCLDNFDQADDALVHLYLADNIHQASDMSIARRVVHRPKFADGLLAGMQKAPGMFDNTMIPSAFTTRNIYMQSLPAFSSYLRNICSFEIPVEKLALTIWETIQNFYQKTEENDKILECLMKLSQEKPKILLSVLQYIDFDGKNVFAEQIFAFLTGLKGSQYDAQPFNRAVSKLFPEFADQLINMYFAHLSTLPHDSEASLYMAFKTSRQSTRKLFELVKQQCGPRISDQVIKILLGCMTALSERDRKCESLANKLVSNCDSASGEELALLFHFSTIASKMEMLSQWLISDTNKAKALVVLRYMFNIPSETKHLEMVLSKLIDLACDNNAKIVEAATKALRAAASSLEKDVLVEIIPYIISTIKSETTTDAIEAAIQFLTEVERKFPLVLIFQIHLLFSALHTVGVQCQKLDEFLELIEGDLRKSQMPSLLEEIVANIRTRKTVMEILRVIDVNIDQVEGNEMLSQICFSMIENHLTITDSATKAMAFKILASLSLPESLSDKVLNYWYGISEDSDRNLLYEHFSKFVNRLSLEKRLYFFEQFSARAEQSLKEFQTSGLSALFGILIGATIDQNNTFSQAIQKLQTTKTTLFRDALMGSLVAFLQNRKDQLLDYLIATAKCLLLKADECVAVSKRLLMDLIKILPNSQVSEFVSLFPMYMASPRLDVREMCILCLISCLQSISRSNVSTQLQDRLGLDVFTQVAAASYVLTFDFFQNVASQAKRLNYLFREGNCDTPVLSLEFVYATRGFLESPSENMNEIVGLALLSVIESWMKCKENSDLDAKTDALLEFWSDAAVSSCGNMFAKQMVFVFESCQSRELANYIAHRVCQLTKRVPMSDDFCRSAIYAILTGMKYLHSLVEAFRKWKLRIVGQFRAHILDFLFTLAHGSVPRVQKINQHPPRVNTPVQEEIKEERSIANAPKNIDILQREARNTFIELCVFLADDIVKLYIEEMDVSPPDSVLLRVLAGLADQKPLFFLSAPDKAINRLLQLLFADVPNDSVRTVEQVLTAVIINLDPPNIGIFLERLSPFFVKLKTQRILRMRLLLNDGFVSSLITGIATAENCLEIGPSIAMFIRAIFCYISEFVRVSLADATVTAFIGSITQRPSMDLVNIIAVISLFAPFMHKLQESALVSAITAGLCAPMTPAIYIEIQSAMEKALALGVSSSMLIALARMRIESAVCPEALELVAFVLEFSKENISETVLLTTWHALSTHAKSPICAMRVAVMRIAALIVARLQGNAREDVLDEALPQDSNDPVAVAGFLTALKDITLLRLDHLATIERLLGSQKDFINFLGAIPMLVKSQSRSLVVQCMNFLVQGIKASGYIVPRMSLDTLAKLRPELQAMDIADASIIVTALYIWYTELDSQMKELAKETLLKIIGPADEKNNFREKYFRSIDASMRNAIERDIFDLQAKKKSDLLRVQSMMIPM